MKLAFLSALIKHVLGSQHTPTLPRTAVPVAPPLEMGQLDVLHIAPEGVQLPPAVTLQSHAHERRSSKPVYQVLD